MGYTTELTGRFDLSKPLTEAQAAYLHKFGESRRMKRDSSKTVDRPDPLRAAVGLGVGAEGGYFVNEGGSFGQGNGTDVTNSNKAPIGQPGLWCPWVPTEDLTGVEWDGNEKFYEYSDWINYLIEHFLAPWGIRVSGRVLWQGEEDDDFGVLGAASGRVMSYPGQRVFQIAGYEVVAGPEGAAEVTEGPAQPVAPEDDRPVKRTVILEIDVFDQDATDALAVNIALEAIKLGVMPRFSVVTK